MSERAEAGRRYIEDQVRRLVAGGANAAGVSRLTVATWISSEALRQIERLAFPSLPAGDKSGRPVSPSAKPIETVDAALLSAESEGSSPPDG